MDRRQFFRRGLQKATESAVKTADAVVEKKAEHWIRPPYAADELAFLVACTRCGKCAEACPHDVIFLLPIRLGAGVVNTPALDLANRGCHLCEDWPCVHACEPTALKLPDATDDDVGMAPRLASIRIDTDRCLPYTGPECGACRYVCPVPGAMEWNMERPTVNAVTCVGCALCLEACITEPKAISVASIKRETVDSQPCE